MTRSDIIRQLAEEYARLRAENEKKREDRIDEVLGRDPSMDELIHGGMALFQSQTRALLARPEQAEEIARQTRQRAAANDRLLRARLEKMGYPANYLDPIYRCALCRDRGYVGDGVREQCACFRQRVVRRMYEETASTAGAAQTFESYDENIFPDDEKYGGYTQRQIALRARDVCRAWSERYPQTDRQGLVLMGETGLGKTFLLNCMENAVIARGYAPTKITGYRLFEAMRGCHFGDADKRTEFDQLLRCELLLLDDLGTEPMMANVTREYLFTLLNERMAQRRHTVIATNLSTGDLLKVYGERVFSRLIDAMSMSVIQLRGRDLRLCGRRR